MIGLKLRFILLSLSFVAFLVSGLVTNWLSVQDYSEEAIARDIGMQDGNETAIGRWKGRRPAGFAFHAGGCAVPVQNRFDKDAPFIIDHHPRSDHVLLKDRGKRGKTPGRYEAE